LGKALERVGLGVRWVGEWREEGKREEGEKEKVIWWARDFVEILDSGILG